MKFIVPDAYYSVILGQLIVTELLNTCVLLCAFDLALFAEEQFCLQGEARLQSIMKDCVIE